MDDRRVGRLVRAARIKKRWRQSDVEAACGIDQTTVSRIEIGRLDGVTLRSIRTVANCVGVRLELQPRMTAAEVTRLLDAGHARLADSVVALLRAGGWTVIVEYTFSHYGERGSVDIVAWRAATRALLIVEIKTRLLDVQELLSTLDRKCRLVPQLLAQERGWIPTVVGRVVVVEDAAAARRVVRSHAATFDVALPARAWRVRSWIADPQGALAGIWFQSSTPRGRRGRPR